MIDENRNINVPDDAPLVLQKLAGYLEQSLDRAMSVVMMRHTAAACTVYLGDPAGEAEELKQIDSIPTALANGMLELTSSGANQISVGDQIYRFVRSFTQIGNTAAIVFPRRFKCCRPIAHRQIAARVGTRSVAAPASARMRIVGAIYGITRVRRHP
ncbi:MAG: hypothetical protein CPDRYMAC_6808 [uncultured Paraburkholderia sp.]|nr:MAG: hypothetical protein CPDRYDRY_6765 [uncultured Paraburkholderia sp.]CAH2945241.1 MAG: hypothetical protein CPDRYMAC_6808 [uncultured Paraburkholderia sp.]